MVNPMLVIAALLCGLFIFVVVALAAVRRQLRLLLWTLPALLVAAALVVAVLSSG